MLPVSTKVTWWTSRQERPSPARTERTRGKGRRKSRRKRSSTGTRRRSSSCVGTDENDLSLTERRAVQLETHLQSATSTRWY